jgi:hypothetical protein
MNKHNYIDLVSSTGEIIRFALKTGRGQGKSVAMIEQAKAVNDTLLIRVAELEEELRAERESLWEMCETSNSLINCMKSMYQYCNSSEEGLLIIEKEVESQRKRLEVK